MSQAQLPSDRVTQISADRVAQIQIIQQPQLAHQVFKNKIELEESSKNSFYFLLQVVGQRDTLEHQQRLAHQERILQEQTRAHQERIAQAALAQRLTERV